MIFSETRSRFRERSSAVPALLLSAACMIGGCTDDVVCGDEVQPYIAARVAQFASGRAGSTHVEVYVVADPLPGTLSVTVTGRQLPDAQEAEGLPGLSTTLSDTQVIWQPGTNCLLEVTTGTGISSALEPIPDAVAVTAPDTADIDDAVTVSWTESSDADYYLVEGIIDGVGDEQVVEVAVDQTSITFQGGELEVPGTLTGRVWAVSGPFPQSGSAGNVTGEGWGYLSVLFRGGESGFSVVLEEPAASAPQPRSSESRILP